jgi:hypothetical protein
MNDFAVHFDFKNSSATRNQLEVLDILAKGVEQLGRQTDGLRRVISHHAEGDLHVHGLLPGAILCIDTEIKRS